MGKFSWSGLSLWSRPQQDGSSDLRWTALTPVSMLFGFAPFAVYQHQWWWTIMVCLHNKWPTNLWEKIALQRGKKEAGDISRLPKDLKLKAVGIKRNKKTFTTSALLTEWFSVWGEGRADHCSSQGTTKHHQSTNQTFQSHVSSWNTGFFYGWIRQFYWPQPLWAKWTEHSPCYTLCLCTRVEAKTGAKKNTGRKMSEENVPKRGSHGAAVDFIPRHILHCWKVKAWLIRRMSQHVRLYCVNLEMSQY